jgi:hypothetical protein
MLPYWHHGSTSLPDTSPEQGVFNAAADHSSADFSGAESFQVCSKLLCERLLSLFHEGLCDVQQVLSESCKGILGMCTSFVVSAVGLCFLCCSIYQCIDEWFSFFVFSM